MFFGDFLTLGRYNALNPSTQIRTMSIQSPGSKNYRSYLLRLVRAQDKDDGWRIRLQEARSGQTHSFKDLQALIDFLYTELGGESDANADSQRRINEG